jgi:hypothetical protein
MRGKRGVLQLLQVVVAGVAGERLWVSGFVASVAGERLLLTAGVRRPVLQALRMLQQAFCPQDSWRASALPRQKL